MYGVHLSSRPEGRTGIYEKMGTMATKIDQEAKPRSPLNKERILRAAVALADAEGVDSLSMRKRSRVTLPTLG